MNVSAALAWFDEPLQQLDDCIRALPVLADRLVAVDGGYRRYPDAEITSPPEQADLIRATCRDVGLDVIIHTPDRLWDGQVAKRSFLLEQASAESDWLMAVDADHIWHGVRYSIRHELEHDIPGDTDCLTVPMWTPMNYDRPIDESAAGDWHAKHADRYESPQRIFRCLPGMRCEKFHWWYSAEKRGRRIWLWGGDGTRPHAKLQPLYAPMLVEHRCLFREPTQIVRNREFCEDRIGIVSATGQEDDRDRDRDEVAA